MKKNTLKPNANAKVIEFILPENVKKQKMVNAAVDAALAVATILGAAAIVFFSTVL